MITIGQWIDKAEEAMTQAGLFFGHGTGNAFDEACWMVSHTLGLAPDFGHDALTQTPSEDQCLALDALLAARIDTRKPLAYLISQAWFAGLPFIVNESVLVPRSPIAELILDNVLPWYDFNDARRVLDVGTGSGCIACAMAHYWTQVTVDAVDISASALTLARSNVDALGLKDRVAVRESDLFSALQGDRYDVILANPPYVPEASMRSLPAEYAHEPALGLVAGADGLSVVSRIISTAKDHLNEGGILICEVGEAMSAFDRWAEKHQLEIMWLAFEHGGEGVFLVTQSALQGLGAHPNEGAEALQ